MTTEETPHLSRIAVFPIKSLDAVEPESAAFVENGGLEHDREYAIFDDDGNYVNGKRTADVHRIRASFDDPVGTVSLRRHGEPDAAASAFDLDDDRDALAEWFGDHFGYSVRVDREPKGGFPDDTHLSGPTVISTGTLREVASWYDGLDVHDVRRRLRANLEIGGVPAFWEDRLFSDHDHAVAFRIGDVEIRGVNPCQRCVVPVRDPDTGEEYPDFQKTFVENRERTLPRWADRTRFDHYFRLMVNTTVHTSQVGETVAVEDPVEVVGEVPLEE